MPYITPMNNTQAAPARMNVNLSAVTVLRVKRIIREVTAAIQHTPSCATVTPEQVVGLAIYMGVAYKETDITERLRVSLVSYATTAMEVQS